MFADDEKLIKLVAERIESATRDTRDVRIGMLLSVLATEIFKHLDEVDKCELGLSFKLNKEEKVDISIAFSGCPVHVAVMATVLALQATERCSKELTERGFPREAMSHAFALINGLALNAESKISTLMNTTEAGGDKHGT